MRTGQLGSFSYNCKLGSSISEYLLGFVPSKVHSLWAHPTPPPTKKAEMGFDGQRIEEITKRR